MDNARLLAMLKLHEGKVTNATGRHMPYKDSTGHLTIGYGRNLTDNGISEQEAEYMFWNDIQQAVREARTFDWFEGLDDVRKNVIVDMIYNLGLGGFSSFKGTIEHIKRGEYEDAARHMLNSLWAKQVKSRAVRLARMMETGEHYE